MKVSPSSIRKMIFESQKENWKWKNSKWWGVLRGERISKRELKVNFNITRLQNRNFTRISKRELKEPLTDGNNSKTSSHESQKENWKHLELSRPVIKLRRISKRELKAEALVKLGDDGCQRYRRYESQKENWKLRPSIILSNASSYANLKKRIERSPGVSVPTPRSATRISKRELKALQTDSWILWYSPRISKRELKAEEEGWVTGA